MQTLRILNTREKKHIAELIKSQFGCDLKLEYEVFMSQKNKIYLLNKDVSRINMDELRINSLGLYFGEVYKEKELRLSIEGSQIVGPLAKKNVLELDEGQAARWMSGDDFEVDSGLYGFVIVKNNADYLGCGRVVERKLLNYMPKERRV